MCLSDTSADISAQRITMEAEPAEEREMENLILAMLEEKKQKIRLFYGGKRFFSLIVL